MSMFSAMQETLQLPVLSLRTLLTVNLIPSRAEGSAAMLSVSDAALSLTAVVSLDTASLEALAAVLLEALPEQAVRRAAVASRRLPVLILFII